MRRGGGTVVADREGQGRVAEQGPLGEDRYMTRYKEKRLKNDPS
jgi:hypothetical protein